jgi:hypothetical protein
MRVFLTILAVLVLLAAAAGAFVWWKVGSLKQELVLNLESALHATVQVTSLDLDLEKGEIHAAGISLVNQSTDAPWDTAEISQATGYFHLLDLLGPTLPLRVSVDGWKMSLHTTVASSLTPSSDNSGATSPPAPAVPAPSDHDRIRVTSISGNEGDVTVRVSGSESISIHGVMFHADTHDGSQWTTDVETTSITAGTLTTGQGSVHLQSEGDRISFDNLSVHCGDGQIAGSGEVTLDGNHAIHGDFTANSVPATMLLSAPWQMKISGLVSGTLAYQSDDSSATANGKMSIGGAKFNVLPWLGKVTALVGLPDISGVELDQATSDFSWKNHILHLQNIDVRKTDVVRVAGQVDLTPDSQVDGHLKLGLPSTVIARWPKLQTDVFSSAQDNYSWTDVRLTGTPDHLQEDLTPRLLAVGAAQSGDLLKSTSQNALDLINSLLK